MDPFALLIIGGLVFPARLAPFPTDRTSEYLAIATRVAEIGNPGCAAYVVRETSGNCLPHYAIRRGRQINAWTYGGRIQFSSGSVRHLTSDQFALLAGHEIAHHYLGHTQSSTTNELEADMLGALLACRAGYRIAAGAELYRHARSGRLYPSPKLRRAVIMGIAKSTACPSTADQSALH